MVDIIILEAHTTHPWPARSVRDTEEIALNVGHIVGVSTNMSREYPGTCILLDGGWTLAIAERKSKVQLKIRHPYLFESDDFILIEHWEHSDVDRIWVGMNGSQHIFETTTSFGLWSRL
jgi:hypothetical protein